MVDVLPIRRALISVSDKRGVVPFARKLAELGVEILSTGGSARTLRDADITVTEVSQHTGFPEILDGRVKTLVPQIHGGILGRRDLPEHIAEMQAHGIAPIDLVAVNLYPFEATVGAGADPAECVETIDIGGPALIRAAAKNHAFVVVLTEPGQYASVLDDSGKQLAGKEFAGKVGPAGVPPEQGIGAAPGVGPLGFPSTAILPNPAGGIVRPTTPPSFVHPTSPVF